MNRNATFILQRTVIEIISFLNGSRRKPCIQKLWAAQTGHDGFVYFNKRGHTVGRVGKGGWIWEDWRRDGSMIRIVQNSLRTNTEKLLIIVYFTFSSIF